MLPEADRNWADPNILEAAIRTANKWCKGDDGTGPSCTMVGYINWITNYSESAGIYPGNGNVPKDPRIELAYYTDASTQALNDIAKGFVKHDSSWDQGCVDTRPCGWGNLSLFPEISDHLVTNQASFFTFKPANENSNPWLIPSGCISKY